MSCFSRCAHLLGAAGMAISLSFGGPAAAKVLAKVGGAEITDEDVALALDDIGGTLPAQLKGPEREAYVVDYLIDMKLVARKAAAEKMAEDPEFTRRLSYMRERALMETLFGRLSKDAVTDAALREIYDQAAKAQKSEPEVKARHILVPTEAEARIALKRVRDGEDFAKVATEVSKDPGSQGGELGWFTKNQMVPEFADAAFALAPNQISEPVKSQFGWHVIKVEDRRVKTFPKFEDVKDQIVQYVIQRAQQDVILKLRSAAKIERARRTRQARTGQISGRGGAPSAAVRISPTPVEKDLPKSFLRSGAGSVLRVSDFRRRHGRNRKTRFGAVELAQTVAVSPLAPKSYPDLPAVEGVRFATAAAGIRYTGRTDVMLALMDKGAQAAGVFTRSRCPSAPVEWCRARLKGGKARALVVNSGNANAFTGKSGLRQAKLTAQIAARATGAPIGEIFLASTGVIGEPLDAGKFEGVFDALVAQASPDGLLAAARAIMTTDTYPKVATARATIAGVEVTINGIAKGAGMIAPDMATMLAYVFTDAPIGSAPLQALLSKSVQKSFNAITVDSDTSTSDTLMMFATGAASRRGAPGIFEAGDKRLGEFRQALDALLLDLAHQVVRDGEGCRKFVEITVEGAASAAAARKVAFSIANSPLVKTAIAGEDANWGRVVMAVGKAGEKADRDRLAIWFGETRVAHKGLRDPSYDEKKISEYMRGERIDLRVDIGVGTATGRVWTCDLTKEYIAINGDYRS